MHSTAIFGTSNNRLTHTVNLICERAGIDIPNGWVYDNGTVIQIVGMGSNCTIRMIHPKVVSNATRFVSPETFNEQFKGQIAVPKALGKTTFVVRHGNAEHNDPATDIERARDSCLTPLGKEQAQKSGIAIYESTGGHLPNLKVYSSDLFRTMQTIEEMLNQFPEDLRINKCDVCIEAREDSRMIGGVHHWKSDDPLRKVSIDPFLPIEKLRELAPGKTYDEVKRMCFENLPKNNPIDSWDECIKNINSLTIDWSIYIKKLKKGYLEGKTFGEVAAEKTLFNIYYLYST